ncbi:MAG: prepilin-type N-terminal cleavage/methylation domain-containing protein [Oscillospiraceae bacterium]
MIQSLKKSKAGFTLVELLVVIAILGVLGAILVPQYIQYVNRSKAGADLATLDECLHAAEVYYASQTAPASSIDMHIAAGVITVGAQLTGILGTSITLKSNEAVALTDATLVITFTSGKAGWTSTPATTRAHFTTIAKAAA